MTRSVIVLADSSNRGFFDDVTWGQIVITASVAAILSVITTLLIEYFAKPSLEVRKHKKLRDETVIDDVIFKLKESRAALVLVAEFSKFNKNGSIIPTRIHMLSQQLEHLSMAAAHVQEDLARLPKRFEIRSDDAKKVHESMADLEAAAIKTRSNINKNDYIEFKNRNQKILKSYLPRIDESITLFEAKK